MSEMPCVCEGEGGPRSEDLTSEYPLIQARTCPRTSMSRCKYVHGHFTLLWVIISRIYRVAGDSSLPPPPTWFDQARILCRVGGGGSCAPYPPSEPRVPLNDTDLGLECYHQDFHKEMAVGNFVG